MRIEAKWYAPMWNLNYARLNQTHIQLAFIPLPLGWESKVAHRNSLCYLSLSFRYYLSEQMLYIDHEDPHSWWIKKTWVMIEVWNVSNWDKSKQIFVIKKSIYINVHLNNFSSTVLYATSQVLNFFWGERARRFNLIIEGFCQVLNTKSNLVTIKIRSVWGEDLRKKR